MNTCEEVAEKIVISFVAEQREKTQVAKSAVTTAENMVPVHSFAAAMNAALKKHASNLKLEAHALPRKYDGKAMLGGLAVNQDELKIVVTPGDSAVTVNGNRVEQRDFWNVMGREVRRLLDLNSAA